MLKSDLFYWWIHSGIQKRIKSDVLIPLFSFCANVAVCHFYMGTSLMQQSTHCCFFVCFPVSQISFNPFSTKLSLSMFLDRNKCKLFWSDLTWRLFALYVWTIMMHSMLCSLCIDLLAAATKMLFWKLHVNKPKVSNQNF